MCKVFEVRVNETTGYISIVNKLTGMIINDGFRKILEAQELAEELNEELRMGMLE